MPSVATATPGPLLQVGLVGLVAVVVVVAAAAVADRFNYSRVLGCDGVSGVQLWGVALGLGLY